MFEKIVALKKSGIKIHLHYFKYGDRGDNDELSKYCESICSYERKTGTKGLHPGLPYIVSSKVKINALISVLIVLMGGAVWGISGMFLSIPFVGILKIIFDRIPELKPWGKLLGDQVPTKHKGQVWNVRKKNVAKP